MTTPPLGAVPAAGTTPSFRSPLPSDAFHACDPPRGEIITKRWWTDDCLPWWVCMFCGQRQMKPTP